MLIPRATAVLLTLPDHLAAVAGARDVLAVHDEGSVSDVYREWAEVPAEPRSVALYSVDVSSRVYAFTGNQYTEIEAILADILACISDDARVIRDADEGHTAAKAQGKFRVAHSRPQVVHFGRSRI